jgi:hypothetical protein
MLIGHILNEVTMKTFKLSPYIVLLVFILAACNLSGRGSKDPFYTDDGGLDYGRFPLIKPYEVASVENIWSIDLHATPSKTSLHFISLHDISQIAVENQVIMVYAPSMALDERKLSWFVLISDKNIETGFSTEAEFLNFVHSYGIENPDWLDPSSVFQTFVKTKCLKWIPDCT